MSRGHCSHCWREARVQAQVALIDGHIDATLDRSGAFRGKVQAAAPEITLIRGDRSLRAAPVRVDASGERQGEALALDVARVDLALVDR